MRNMKPKILCYMLRMKGKERERDLMANRREEDIDRDCGNTTNVICITHNTVYNDNNNNNHSLENTIVK